MAEPTNTDAELNRATFVSLAEPIKRFLMKNGMPDAMAAAMTAANIVLEIQPAVQSYADTRVAEARRDSTKELEPYLDHWKNCSAFDAPGQKCSCGLATYLAQLAPPNHKEK